MGEQGRIRVLHVVVNMNRGGAETLLMNLYRKIDREKVQFDFLTCKAGAFDEEIVRLGGRVHRIPYVTDVGHMRFKKRVENFLLKNDQYKIVHSHMDKMSGIVLRSAQQANVPVRIAHSHNTESEGGFLTKAYKWYAGRLILPSATHLYACSQAAAKWLFHHQSEKAFIFKNGIDMSTFEHSPDVRQEVRKELEISNDTLVLGHVGRFSSQKNHLFLLDAFAKVNQREPNSLLLLAGDGPLKPAIMKRIKELKVENKVKLLGVREDIERLLQAFDQFIFPSHHEGLPVTLIEAQGAGLPCIISRNITKEVDMGTGLVHYLPITNATLWGEKILHIAMKKQARKVPQSALRERGYDIKKTAKTAQKAYSSLLKEVDGL